MIRLKLSRILTLSMYLLLGGSFLQAQSFNTAYIDSVFTAYHQAHRFNGQVLVAHRGEVFFEKSYGYANFEEKTPFTQSTHFQIASLSKQFTSFGILYLQQKGKLSIDDSLQKYFPELPYPGITLKHLMNHTSGLPNFVNSMIPDLDKSQVNGNAQMLKMLASGKYPSQAAPGERWEYCDIGYCLLALVIEEVSGKRFDKFMKKALFAPAGMKGTSAELGTDIRNIEKKQLAMGYTYEPGQDQMIPAHLVPANEFVYWLGGFYGDGSVVSTARDLLKWDQLLYSSKMFSKETLDVAFTPTKLNDGTLAKAWGTDYGLGWMLFDGKKYGIDSKIVEHAGGHPGIRSRLTRCIDKQLTIIILSNQDIENFHELRVLQGVYN
ncbi:serine hydrolase domain-containing protein [Rapidithrix thailandica]|uniref:Serine hydrolase domain-containing protein n=1 Tax=Rapidithrix thailandica TaxID=413964 RepID=A0AAW9S5D5_9BACT